METSAKDIDHYISAFPPQVQNLLNQVRSTIRQAAPEAKESIKYAIPTFELHGNLVHFAAFRKHLGFYPVPSGMQAFEQELAAFKQGKGSVQFPLDQPLPLDLITRIVRFRVEENKIKAKKKKGSSPAR
ncbi:MAG: iron chaperone [Adhaeribacter sp.]